MFLFIPIVWKYLLNNYFKVLFLCTFAFLALLLTLRLTEIASFAALGAKPGHLIYFTICQILYILPIALPIAALISAVLLVQQLSKTGELTALRSSGLSLSSIFAPLVLAASFFSLLNFYIASEAATYSHLSTALIKAELRGINPLLILGNKYLMKLRGIYCDTLGPSKVGESASDVVLAMPSKGGNLNLLVAKNLQSSPLNFKGQGITVLSSLPHDQKALFLENMGQTTTSIKDFTLMVHKKTCTLNNDHLKMSFLLSRHLHEKLNYQNAVVAGRPVSELKQKQRALSRIYSEIMRRFSLALAVLSFTLLGVSCGIQLGREASIKGISILIVLAALYIAAYFSAKGAEHLLLPSLVFYSLPHILIVAVSLFMLRRAAKGIA